MPSIKDKSTVEAIAREFCSNGRNKEKALKAVGYSDNYAEHRATEVLGSVGVKQAIAGIDAKSARKVDWGIEKAQSMLMDTYDQAVDLNQPSAQVSAIIAINRMFGMDKDAAVKDDKPESLTPDQVEEYRAMARAAIKLRLA